MRADAGKAIELSGRGKGALSIYFTNSLGRRIRVRHISIDANEYFFFSKLRCHHSSSVSLGFCGMVLWFHPNLR